MPFIPTTGVELLNPGRVREVFARARKYAPAMVFIDEIDAVGRRDMGGDINAINELLTALDGFDANDERPVFVVAATNYFERVDEALIRSGRIDYRELVPALDRDARGFFVDKFLALAGCENLSRPALLSLTTGLNGSQLEQVLREVRMKVMTASDSQQDLDIELVLTEEINAICYGRRDARPRSAQALKRTAVHEAGHAVVMRLLNPDMVISQISITQRSRTLGRMSLNLEDSPLREMTAQEVKDDIAVCLAGLVAERVLLASEHTPGALSDLEQATRLALQAVTEWGMDEKLGLIHRPTLVQRRQTDDGTGEAIADAAIMSDPSVEAAVRRWLTEAEQRVTPEIQRHRESIQALADELMMREEIAGEELDRWMSSLSSEIEILPKKLDSCSKEPLS